MRTKRSAMAVFSRGSRQHARAKTAYHFHLAHAYAHGFCPHSYSAVWKWSSSSACAASEEIESAGAYSEAYRGAGDKPAPLSFCKSRERKGVETMEESHEAGGDGRSYYITTAIDYPNAEPHIGHTLEKVAADAIARYRRLQGDDTYFSMGLD